ncbi:TetR family transcriptional regulator [Siminovitchia terrae]|uniref:TetR family transcriptional regulator n=1 Tax=Siminovitchia terrae TaxID=1914933 RepID=A0A429X3D1_SIMTE|nr:TetR family transcriptional regulator [Siminovitchia terrae]RST57874.1 TetR/AcrR family transcriptional regulator [Siminovitchia terrae]GIN98289.1 TetR family transcriptional regulator [Siminovitchia terrae]
MVDISKKEKIINAAVQVFQEKGIEKTKVSDIVKLAGIAQGTFYLYFPSKLSVMPAIAEVMVKKFMVEVKNEVDESDSISTQLSQIVNAIFRVTKNYREVLALIYAGLSTDDNLKNWETIYDAFYSWMSDFLTTAKLNGKIRSSVHPERTSKLMIAFIEAAAEQIYLYDAVNEEEERMQKSELIMFLEHALGIQN